MILTAVLLWYFSNVLIDFFIWLVTAHLADGILQHGVLLIEMVNSFLTLGVVVHRTLQEEAQEALRTVTTGAGCSRGRGS